MPTPNFNRKLQNLSHCSRSWARAIRETHCLIQKYLSKFDLELSITSLSQGHVYSLIGGVSDDRLALMHLGYKHMQGLDGFPKDQNTAYGYYANIGKQTSIDRDEVQDSLVSYTFIYWD